MARKQNENLIPANKRSLEEVRENARKGGIKSGETRRRKKSMRELASIVNSLPLSENNKKELVLNGIKEKNADYQMAFVWQVYQKAMKGDVKAMKLWVELSEYMNDTKAELEIAKLKAEINKLNVEASSSIEDLTGLADMLKMKNEDDNDE